MKETFIKNGVKITMHLNGDNSVNLQQKMDIEYVDQSGELKKFSAYPDTENGKIGTISCQFEYIDSSIAFDDVFDEKNNADSFKKKVKDFFEERPNISISGISKESGLDSSHLPKIIKNQRGMTEYIKNKILPILIKYGYKE